MAARAQWFQQAVSSASCRWIFCPQCCSRRCWSETQRALSCSAAWIDEEDLALCSFVCNGKYNYGPHLRKALDEIEAGG